MKKIVLAGGTGNLGQLLTHALLEMDYAIVILSRSEATSQIPHVTHVKWDGESLGDWSAALSGADAIINLSGKSVQCRFTEKNKAALIRSRILPTQVLGKCIEQLEQPPRIWINFSGIAIFESVPHLSDENSHQYGSGFLARLSQEWESAFFNANTVHTKKVCLRISPVLSNNFGMFKELRSLTKIGLAGKVGNGKQCMPWIHEQDLVQLVCWVLMHKNPSLLYHACNVSPVTNEVFMRTLRKAAGIPIGLPLPTFVTKLGAYFKGVESSVLLNTIITTTTKTVEEGFQFLYPNLEEAFGQLIETT